MRVLSTVTGSVGHAHEILPMVRALVAAGHHVVVAPSPHLAPVFAGTGAEVVDAMPDFLASTEHLRTLRTTGFPGYEPDGGPADPRIELIAFAAGPQVTTAYEALLPIAEELRPDLVYREGSELAGCLIAEKLGIPHITGPTGVGNVLDPAGLNLLLNERRKDVGLPEKDDAWSMYPNGWLDSLPVGFSFAQYDMPEPVRYLPPMPMTDDPLPAELAELAADRPLVLASMGTALPTVAGMRLSDAGLAQAMADPVDTLRALVAGLSTVDCHAVVTTGGIALDGVDAGPNVHIVDRVPQPLLLQSCDLFVTHCGFNSLRESLRTGVPMMMMPQFGDQPHNADRAAELGLGARVPVVSAEAVAATCRQLLADDKVRTSVRTVQRLLLGLPPIQAAVRHLESLATA